MGGVSMEYEETVVERRVRRVRVEDDEGGEVTAWHGGRMLARLSGWACLRRAIEDAREQAERFAVGPGSTLSIRVDRTLTRRWSYPDGRHSDRPKPDRLIYRRHVLDMAKGEMPFAEGRIGFRLSGWVGVAPGADPLPCLPFFAGASVEGISDAALFAGYGFGEVECGPATLSGPAAGPAPPAPRPGRSYHRVSLEGALPVYFPPGSAAIDLAGKVWLQVAHDWDAIPEGLRGAADFICPERDLAFFPAPGPSPALPPP